MTETTTLDDVGALRRFNRSYTPLVGVLDESFLGTGRPLAAARLLFEIGHGAVGVHELRHRLGIDSGYLSRLLRTLERDNLITVSDDPSDRRRRIVDLTSAGRTEWRLLDQRSDQIATDLLTGLEADDRAELATALAKAERLLRLASISFRIVDPASVAALSSLGQYYEELDQRFSNGFDVRTPAAGTDDAMMRAPFGGFVVIDDGDETRGCGGLQRIDERTAEIKRMWLHPSLRGFGLGKRLVHRLETLAAELGYDVVVLDTNEALSEAISLYGALGYEVTERYNDNPYAHHWFRKELT